MEDLTLRELTRDEIEKVVEIISTSMNPDEGKWAEKTLNFHFFCKENNVDDGRVCFVALMENKIVGIVGLHHYIWGPDDITWLSWFAVCEDRQRKGIGTRLISKTVEIAGDRGFKKMLIETYSGKDFAKARSFYSKSGFERAGKIKGYMGDDDMVIFGKKINT